MICIENLSHQYVIKKLTTKDIPSILKVTDSNPAYYTYVPPVATKETLQKDMKELPKNTNPKDKFYVGFYQEKQLVAILDFILNYPDPHTVFISFFMVHQKYQKKGIGSHIIQDISLYLPPCYTDIYLGVVQKNKQAQQFWQKNGFTFTEQTYTHPEYTILMMTKKRSFS